MLTLVLYPYVYLLTRAAFLEQSVCVLEVSRTLGSGPFGGFRRVALPLARPAIVAGLSLALMEVLADYGTVAYFGVSTFTTGIFRTWYGLGDPAAAAQLAAVLLTFVFVLIVFERWSRAKARFHHTSRRYSRLPRYPLRGWKAAAAFLACLLPVFLGFLLPAFQLGLWAFQTTDYWMDASFAHLIFNSFWLAVAAALIAVALALVLAYARRMEGGLFTTAAVRVAGMGYAVPGTVIAIGIMIPFAAFDNAVDSLMRETFGFSTGLLLSGTAFALLFAYAVRFLAVSLQTVEAGLGKIQPSMDDAARSLGLRPLGTLTRVHLPIMRGTLLTALLLVFVDVLKELPATLILRPSTSIPSRCARSSWPGTSAWPNPPARPWPSCWSGCYRLSCCRSPIGRSRPGQQGPARPSGPADDSVPELLPGTGPPPARPDLIPNPRTARDMPEPQPRSSRPRSSGCRGTTTRPWSIRCRWNCARARSAVCSARPAVARPRCCARSRDSNRCWPGTIQLNGRTVSNPHQTMPAGAARGRHGVSGLCSVPASESS